MYESPIEIMMHDIQEQIIEQRENSIMCQIKEQMGINIDKDELMKALCYDRDQYHKGIEDAKQTLCRVCRFRRFMDISTDLHVFDIRPVCGNPDISEEATICNYQCIDLYSNKED